MYCLQVCEKGDEATDLHILSHVDNTYAPATQLLDDTVMRDDLPD